ncbi:MAG: hypothetical protein DI551_08945 [Micavibrio aeruginosavorus]|uniref:Uncharacterized protein n=1 Tax=Micavibrio aeruginosavorus TaxID=349221 RepID=A0A2W5PK54_9BACT|nr:MAG: hypothetical protein DI551_08945 [Micavibrio aeruginosavorus]
MLHVDNDKKLLGMFPFAAQFADASGQRVQNIEKYNRLGVAILEVDEDRLLATLYHEHQQKTPVQYVDAAAVVLKDLCLIKSVNVPEAKPISSP